MRPKLARVFLTCSPSTRRNFLSETKKQKVKKREMLPDAKSAVRIIFLSLSQFFKIKKLDLQPTGSMH